MTTIIAVYNTARCISRCDATCYNAIHPKCRCICGGANHGKGEDKALENSAERIGLRPDDLRTFAAAHGFACEEVRVVDRLIVPDNRHARQQAKDAIENSRNQVEMFE